MSTRVVWRWMDVPWLVLQIGGTWNLGDSDNATVCRVYIQRCLHWDPCERNRSLLLLKAFFIKYCSAGAGVLSGGISAGSLFFRCIALNNRHTLNGLIWEKVLFFWLFQLFLDIFLSSFPLVIQNHVGRFSLYYNVRFHIIVL